MPKIKNWSRRWDLERQTHVTRVWEHDETGELVWVSDYVPNDGYYVYMCESEDEFHDNRHANSVCYDYSHRKSDTLKLTTSQLRKHQTGFKGDDT